MDNLAIYNRLRAVPDSARKTIAAGRLKGMTDVSPMWRIKALTEEFGPCGVGWKYRITDKRLEPAADGTVAAFVDIELFTRQGDGWSEPIPGTGGSLFAANERGGLHVSDECFKMALTDALSVAGKALGLAADVYWERDRTKYSPSGERSAPSRGWDAEVGSPRRDQGADAPAAGAPTAGVPTTTPAGTRAAQADTPPTPMRDVPPRQGGLICADCGQEIRGIRKDGAAYIAAEVAKRMDGRCYHCGVKHGLHL